MSSLLAMLIFSTIGLFILREAKKKTSYSLMIIGVTLLFYSYFTQEAWQDWTIGCALCGLAYYLRI